MKHISKIAFLLILSLTVFACSEQDETLKTTNNNSNEKNFSFKKANLKIDYTSTLTNNQLFFKININNISSNKNINETFNINLSKVDFYKDISNQITEKQKRISNDYTLTEIRTMVSVMDDMVLSETNEITNDELKDMRTQGLFVCNSLVKSISRLISKKDILHLRIGDGETQTTNTVYEGFKREMSSFALDEDLQINVQDYITYIENNPELGIEKGFTFVKGILENKNSTNISLTELQNDILTFTINNPNLFEGDSDPVTGYRWPQGSDHGCCGNYSGNCWYWHPACWVHDKMCSDCTPRWFCFSGCVPD